MLLPHQYAWAEPVAIGSVVVFIVAWIGYTIGSSSRFLTALVAALVFALIFGPLAHFRLATLSIDVAGRPSTREPMPAQTQAPTAPQQPRKPPANPVTTVPNEK